MSGQMSYWALSVILNLLTVILVIGNYVLDSLLGNSFVTDSSLQRIAVVHMLLALGTTAIVGIHITCVHRVSPGYDSIEDCRIPGLLDVLCKDLVILVVILVLHGLLVLETLIHPDNWQRYSTMVTPAHIEPETYFLWAFSIIKSHPSKITGLLRGISEHTFTVCSDITVKVVLLSWSSIGSVTVTCSIIVDFLGTGSYNYTSCYCYGYGR